MAANIRRARYEFGLIRSRKSTSITAAIGAGACGRDGNSGERSLPGISVHPHRTTVSQFFRGFGRSPSFYDLFLTYLVHILGQKRAWSHLRGAGREKNKERQNDYSPQFHLHASQFTLALNFLPSKKFGGAERDRTADLLNAIQALS
ncbi:MAG: hypothetical protein AABZ69_01655, partial [Candidatus Binatota bacterium]